MTPFESLLAAVSFAALVSIVVEFVVLRRL